MHGQWPPPVKASADVLPQVIEYLVKKGYNRTEQMLRQESSHLDKEGKPIHERVEDFGTMKYAKAYRLFSGWIDQNLDIYKVGIHQIYTFLDQEFKLTRDSMNFDVSYGQSSSTPILNSS